MSKENVPAVVTTTTAHLSRAVEAILRRFPEGARPSKNQLLNDLAAALRPGKNWGGLLVEAKAPTQERTLTIDPMDLCPRPMHASSGSISVGAVIRHDPDMTSAINLSPLDDPGSLEAMQTGVDGSRVVGMVFDLWESVAGFEVSPHLDFLLEAEDGGCILDDIPAIDLPEALCAAALGALQSVWKTDWRSLLDKEGVHNCSVVVGAGPGAGVIPLGADKRVASGKAISAQENEAVRLYLPDDLPAGSPEGEMVKRLAEWALARLSARDERMASAPSVRIIVDGPPIKRGRAIPQSGSSIARPDEGSEVVVVDASKSLIYGDGPHDVDHLDVFRYRLCEALGFALDFSGVAPDEDVWIHAVCGVSGRKRPFRFLVERSWSLVTWRDGQMCEWQLANPDEDRALRRNIEAWIGRGVGVLTVVGEEDMSTDRMSLLFARNRRRDGHHWDAALKLFVGAA